MSFPGYNLICFDDDPRISFQRHRRLIIREAMRIGLIDIDGHHFPNLALMKLSAWHKSHRKQGYENN